MKAWSIIVVFLLLLDRTPQAFLLRKNRRPMRMKVVVRNHHFLTTAYEQILDQRRILDSSYREIGLIDDATFESISGEYEIVPLYPLPAVYLPHTGENHTLCNTEPQNIAMAMDMLQGKSPDFCTVLRCVDSGRWASVGTRLRILEADPQEDVDGLARVMLTCQAKELLDVVGIEKSENGYFLAHVRPRRQTDDVLTEGSSTIQTEDDDTPILIDQLISDYKAVRNFYLNGVGTQDLPPFARDRLEEGLPKLTRGNVTRNLWKVAQTWQTLCYTIREGRQIALAGDRNELLVAAANRKGGPLCLPIRLSDISEKDREAVQRLEEDAFESWVDIVRLDPTLDFLSFIFQPTFTGRTRLLATLVNRERERLTRMALAQSLGGASWLE